MVTVCLENHHMMDSYKRMFCSYKLVLDTICLRRSYSKQSPFIHFCLDFCVVTHDGLDILFFYGDDLTDDDDARVVSRSDEIVMRLDRHHRRLRRLLGREVLFDRVWARKIFGSAILRKSE